MSVQPYDFDNLVDEDGKPAGGWVEATGIFIEWQNGPLVDPATGVRQEPNGAFVETVIKIALDRIAHYQGTPFECPENERAAEHLRKALQELKERTMIREARGVEGTHTP